MTTIWPRGAVMVVERRYRSVVGLVSFPVCTGSFVHSCHRTEPTADDSLRVL